MTSGGPDFYRQRLAFAQDTWNEAKGHPTVFYPPRRKERVFSRSEKRRARQEAHVEIANDNDLASEILSCDPCRNGT